MNRKRSKKRTSTIKILFFTIIIFYLVYKAISGLFMNDPITEIVNYGELVSEKEYECVIIRNEEVINSPQEGSIKYFVEEGEKVEKGYNILEIYTSEVNEEDREKLMQLNKRIDNIQSNKDDLFLIDIEKINKKIETIVNEIKKNRLEGNFHRIEELKRELEDKIEKKRIINGDKSFSGFNLQSLKAEKNKLENKIKNSITEIKSPKSGIISYNIDGFEDILTPENISKIKYDYIESMEIKLNNLKLDKVIYDQPLFKIIDNTYWYIVVITDLQDSFKKGQKVFIDMYDTRISGVVQDVFNNGNKKMVIIKTNQYAKDFYKVRKGIFNIVKEHYTGLKIHRDSIVQKNGKIGVYILDVNNKAYFKPIKIKGYNDDFAIVHNNFFYEKKGDESIRVGTLELYDEILRNAAKYEEGQIIY